MNIFNIFRRKKAEPSKAKRKRKTTRMKRYVCPWKGTRYYRKLAEDVPAKCVERYINSGWFGRPGVKWWRDELVKVGRMTKDFKPIYQKRNKKKVKTKRRKGNPNPQMPFGKHKGKFLKDLPEDYIRWLHTNGGLDKKETKWIKDYLIKCGKLSA